MRLATDFFFFAPAGLSGYGRMQRRSSRSVPPVPSVSLASLSGCQRGATALLSRSSSRALGRVNVNASPESTTRKSPRRSSIKVMLADGQYHRSVTLTKCMPSEEIQTLDIISLGFSNPGSILLLKLRRPLDKETYPFNLHERAKAFLPGDAVGLQMKKDTLTICFSRAGDLMAPCPVAAVKRRFSMRIRDSDVIGSIKYQYIQHIKCITPPPSAKLLEVRITGAGGLEVSLSFSDTAMCSVFVKLLTTHCRGRGHFNDDVGVVSGSRKLSSAGMVRCRSLSFGPQRCSSTPSVSRLTCGGRPGD